MNERIKLLAGQVYGTQATEQEVQFAQLIIKECIGQIKELCDSDGGDVGSEYVEGFEGGMFLAIEKIEDHFGVDK